MMANDLIDDERNNSNNMNTYEVGMHPSNPQEESFGESDSNLTSRMNSKRFDSSKIIEHHSESSPKDLLILE
jgi:hypothetical protein